MAELFFSLFDASHVPPPGAAAPPHPPAFAVAQRWNIVWGGSAARCQISGLNQLESVVSPALAAAAASECEAAQDVGVAEGKRPPAQPGIRAADVSLSRAASGWTGRDAA